MPDEPGFFSDPKVLISLLALLISMISLIWNFANQWEQNRRWNAINAAHIVLREAKILPWEKISRAEAESRNWGYPPFVFGGDLRDEAYVYSALKLRSKKTDAPTEGARIVSTTGEVLSEIKRLKLQANDILVSKTLRPFFQLENIGKTPAYKLNISIDMLDAVSHEVLWRRAFNSNSTPDLGPGMLTSVYFDVGLPAEQQPKNLSFRLNIGYEDINGNKKSTTVPVSWDANDNYWHYSPANGSLIE